MKKVITGLCACALLGVVAGCQKEREPMAAEVAEAVCRAMNDRDIDALRRFSHGTEEDFKAIYEVVGGMSAKNCHDFVHEREFSVVRFSVDPSPGAADQKPRDMRLTLYKEGGQWKCLELDRDAANARRQRESKNVPATEENVKAAE